MSILEKVLGTLSGSDEVKISKQLLFDKVVGFRGIKDGVGCSTVVQNVAIAMSQYFKGINALNICVVDTNILYPAQMHLLGCEGLNKKTDWFDLGNDINEVVFKTEYKNVYCVGFTDRTILDLISTKDTSSLVEKLFSSLKIYFDIILVDISHEPSVIATYSAKSCNRIYSIIEPSMTCVVNMKNSLNNLASLGVAPFKLKKVIINKALSDINLGLGSTLNKYNLSVLAEIPFSEEIARLCANGNKIWSSVTMDKTITMAHIALETIIKDIVESNLLNDEFSANIDTSANIKDSAIENNMSENSVVDTGEKVVEDKSTENVEVNA